MNANEWLTAFAEKLGTAPPSTDVKAGPTKAEPAGTPPTVQKGTPKVHNR